MRYLDLVKAALWGRQSEWPAAETEELLRLNAAQCTDVLVYPMVLAQDGLSDVARTKMKSVCVNAMHKQVKLQHVLEQAWRALEKANIPAVLLKGAGLAALYPDSQLRSWRDVDVFVGKENYHAACAAIREVFPETGAIKEEMEYYKHYNIHADEIPVEIHRVTMSLQHPMDKRRYERIEKYGMTHGELHHYTKELKPELFEQWLRQLNLLDVWQLYAYNLVYCLGLSREESLLLPEKVSAEVSERAEKMMDEMISGEKFKGLEVRGLEVRGVEVKEIRWVRKWRTMQQRMRCAKRIKEFSPSYARHMNWTTWLHGIGRLFAKDRKWE